MVFTIKSKINIPVILFQGNVTGVVLKPMQSFFALYLIQRILTLLLGRRLWGALSVKKYKIESLPTGYLVIGEHTTA